MLMKNVTLMTNLIVSFDRESRKKVYIHKSEYH